jgi:general stress protein 26
MKPQPAPVNEADLPALAHAAIREAKFPMLATIDGDRPRLRPVSPVRTDGFTIWVASLRSSHKTAEIEANPNVELCYMTAGHDQVRITGVAETITDMAIKQSVWDENPLLRMFLGSIENPEFVLYKIVPSRVRFMREWALEYYELKLTDLASSAGSGPPRAGGFKAEGLE